MFTRSQLLLQGLALAVAIGVSPQIAVAGETLEGVLIANQRGHVAAEMTGERSQRVKDVLVRPGDIVKKDEPLARLDTTQLEADRLISQRALEEARAAIELEKANVARAQLDFDRRAGLKGSPSFNRAAFEDAEVALRAAEAKLQSAQSSAARREAEVARVDIEIRLAEIKAPYDGLVVEVLTGVGASVTQRMPNLFTLLDLDSVEVAVPVPAGEAAKLLAPGQSVSYAVADGKKRAAKVRAVLPPLSPKESGPMARLQLERGDLPQVIQHQQPVQVYLGQ